MNFNVWNGEDNEITKLFFPQVFTGHKAVVVKFFGNEPNQFYTLLYKHLCLVLSADTFICCSLSLLCVVWDADSQNVFWSMISAFSNYSGQNQEFENVAVLPEYFWLQKFMCIINSSQTWLKEVLFSSCVETNWLETLIHSYLKCISTARWWHTCDRALVHQVQCLKSTLAKHKP